MQIVLVQGYEVRRRTGASGMRSKPGDSGVIRSGSPMDDATDE